MGERFVFIPSRLPNGNWSVNSLAGGKPSGVPVSWKSVVAQGTLTTPG